MKFLFTILMLFGVAKAQCDTSTIHNIKLRFDVEINTNKWNYYNSNGSPAWKNVTGYDSTLIPAGGWAIRVTTSKTIDGYGELKVINPVDCELGLLTGVDLNHKAIDGYIKSWRQILY